NNTLANMEHVSHVLAQGSGSIENSLKSADVFLANMAKVSQDFPKMLQELKTGVAKFNTLATDLSQAGTKVSSTMVSGKNAIDTLSPEAAVLLGRLNTISANLEKVTNDMRQNPSVIIRGTSPPKPGPGE
ncbi:MAG: MCE family protein, partial [Legionellales bacterium]